MTSYITKDEFLSIPLAQRGRALLQAIPVGEESEPLVSHVLTHASKDSLNMKEDVDNLVATAAAHHVTKFSRNTAGFTCEADGGTYFFSVPADPGWTLCIDNEESPIINACGLMLASVPEGHHTLSFTYQTPGLRTGIMVSILGWATFTILALRNRIVRHGNANMKRPSHNNPTRA